MSKLNGICDERLNRRFKRRFQYALTIGMSNLILRWKLYRALAQRKRLRMAGYARHYRRAG